MKISDCMNCMFETNKFKCALSGFKSCLTNWKFIDRTCLVMMFEFHYSSNWDVKITKVKLSEIIFEKPFFPSEFERIEEVEDVVRILDSE